MAVGCRAHTGWAALVVVAGGLEHPEVVLRDRAELDDPRGRVRRNAYHAARGLDSASAAELVNGAERIAAERAAATLERTVRDVADAYGGAVHRCAVVVGPPARGLRLESILASHALVHAAEGRLYQDALLRGGAACGLDTVAVAKGTIWEEGASRLGIPRNDLRPWIDELRRALGPPWAEDQKLAALAAWIALARSS